MRSTFEKIANAFSGLKKLIVHYLSLIGNNTLRDQRYARFIVALSERRDVSRQVASVDV